MRRREFITLASSVAIAWPLAVRAQQRGVPIVGFLRGGTAAGGANLLAAFRKGLSETGFVEGRNLEIEFRWGLDSRERQAEAAADMVRRQVDVIVAPGFSVAALAAKALTTRIPIIFTTSGDPVQLGLVASLMSHELRTPLAAMLGYAELMEEGTYEPLGEKSLAALTRIRSSAGADQYRARHCQDRVRPVHAEHGRILDRDGSRNRASRDRVARTEQKARIDDRGDQTSADWHR
jgi:signal transduction histidine kinase